MTHPTFVHLLAERFAQRAEAPYARFLADGEVDGAVVRWSWADLDRRSASVAGALRAHAAPGDRALIVAPAGLDFVAAFLGCLRAGVVAVPVAPPVPKWRQHHLATVAAIAADAGARVVLTVEGLADTQPGELASMPWLPVETLPAAPAPDHRPTPDDIAFLQYTSGSTGRPKGVIVPHRQVMANMGAIADAFGHVEGRTTGVCWLPMFHDMGLIGSVLHPIWLDSPEMTFLQPGHFLRKPVRWLRALTGREAVTSGGPDFAYALCCDRIDDAELEGLDLSGWRVAYSGAEPVRRATLERFAARFASVGFRPEAFLPCYGLAEATLLVSGRHSGRDSTVLDADGQPLERVSCGLVAPGHEVRVVDPATGQELPRGRVGALWVRGPSVSPGYWGQPPLEGPFLDTGDLGALDDEGELVIAGRTRELVIVRGRNLHPADVEQAVYALDPTLRAGSVAAFGAEVDGREQLVIAVEVRRPDPELPSRVAAAVAEDYGVRPAVVALVKRGALPRTSSGKLRRVAVAAAFAGGTLDAHPTSDVLEELLAWMRAEVGIPHPDPHRSFVEQGLDSLQLATLASRLEARTRQEVPVERFYAVTPAELSTALQADDLALPDVQAIDWASVLRLPDDVRPDPGAPERAHPVWLVTGVTGFLGAHLLHELLTRTGADLLCLVRCERPEEGRERVRANLVHYGLWDPTFAARLRIEPADLAAAGLGLQPGRWDRLASQVTAVLHCGAHVHWGLPYAQLASANVQGTVELARLACQAGGVPFHFVSSLGVFPVGISPRDRFAEDDALLDGENLDLGYFQSKWVAERLLHEARARGLPVRVYRPGFIGGHSRTGQSSPDQQQLFASFLTGCLQLGEAPDVDKVMDIVSVDDVARAIVTLALDGAGPAHNLLHRRPLRQQALYAHLRQRGHGLATVAYHRWRQRVLALPPDSPNPLVAFQGFYRLQTPARMRRLEVLLRHEVPIDAEATHAALAGLGATPRSFDGELVDTWLDALDVPARSGAPAPTGPVITLVDYDVHLDSVERLYQRATRRQWNAGERLPWDEPTDTDNPLALPDEAHPLYGSDLYRRMDPRARTELRTHVQAWQLSQFLHGEQGALLCASQIVQHAPTLEARLFAGTQVADEARHVEVFDRLLRERFAHRYPITPPLQRLLDDVLSDSRWDVTYLGMQVLIEGLALAAFAQIRDQSSNRLAAAINAYVMEDEARHVAFGRLVLADHYPKLTQAERDEREEFVIEATYLLRDRFDPTAVWEALGLPVEACSRWLRESGLMSAYRRALFSRIVPTVRAIGLWGPNVQRAYERMGLLSFAQVDLDALQRDDERVARVVEAR